MGLAFSSKFTKTSVKKLIEGWSAKYKETYVEKLVIQLRAFLNYLIREGYYTQVDYEKLELPRAVKRKRSTVIVNHDEVSIFEYLEKTGDEDFRMYLRTVFFTGSRPGEIRSLQVEHINFADGTIRIFQPKVGKWKTVVVTDAFLTEIRQYIESQGITDYLFTGSRMNPEYYGKKFKEIKRILGINPKYQIYDLRKLYALYALNQTRDIDFVSSMLGHSNVETTRFYYIHRQTSDFRKLIEGFDQGRKDG